MVQSSIGSTIQAAIAYDSQPILCFFIFENTHKNAAQHEKFAFGGLENKCILLPGSFRVRASLLSGPTKASFVFPYILLYNENAPKTIENDLSADLKIYQKSFIMPSGSTHGVGCMSYLKALPL